MSQYYNSYYIISNKPDYGLIGFAKDADILSEENQTKFLEDVAHLIVNMKFHNGYDIDFVVLNGSRLKWILNDTEMSDLVEIEFIEYHSEHKIQSIITER